MIGQPRTVASVCSATKRDAPPVISHRTLPTYSAARSGPRRFFTIPPRQVWILVTPPEQRTGNTGRRHSGDLCTILRISTTEARRIYSRSSNTTIVISGCISQRARRWTWWNISSRCEAYITTRKTVVDLPGPAASRPDCRSHPLPERINLDDLDRWVGTL